MAIQLAEMWQRMDAGGALDLVEAGAGDGRLTRDILDALATDRPDLYARLHVTLVERSDPARRAAATTLHAHSARVEDIRAGLPERIRGVLLAERAPRCDAGPRPREDDERPRGAVSAPAR